MNQEVAVIHEDPFRRIVAFDADRKLADRFQPFLYLISNGVPLPGVQNRADNEVVGKRGDFAQV